MTAAQIAARAARQATIPQAGGKDRAFAAFFRALMYGAVGLSVLALATLLYDVARDGAPRVSWDFLTSFPSRIIPASSGVQSALYGTLSLMVICAVIVVPLGVATAVYLEEYADRTKWWNRLVEVNIQNLAAVPSVVYGILGLAFIVRGPVSLGRTLLAGGITLSLLVLPVVIIVAREAIRAVPPSIREGSLALGATQWQTIWKQVLPASVPGFATGVILAVSRAIGEAAPLIVVGGAVYLTFYPSGLGSDFTVLPLQIFNWISQPQEEFKNLAAAGMIVLLAILLLLNAVAIWLRNKYEKKW
jgi:phosphate transport system permease protein